MAHIDFGNSACVNGLPISLKVLPMVPWVIPLVPILMPMVALALPMVPLVNQWYHWENHERSQQQKSEK